VIGALLLDLNPAKLLSLLSIFVAYYNTVATFFTCLFSTRLGAAEARSLSFLIQALFCVTGGLWLHSGDSSFFYVLEWIKYINPQYWAVSSLIYLNVHLSGECEIFGDGNTCLVTTGDAFESYFRLVDIPSSTSIFAILGLWTGLRLVQYFILRFNGLNK
jgi:hypothetical protein